MKSRIATVGATISLLLCLCGISHGQTCNSGNPWLTQYATITLGNAPQFGPGCNQLDDSGINLSALQNQVNSLALVLLNVVSGTAAVNLNDQTSFTSAYNDYVIVLENIVPSVNAISLALNLKFGGTVQNTSYINTAGGSTTGFDLTAGSSTVSNNTLFGFSGTIECYNVNSIVINKMCNLSRGAWLSSAGGIASSAQATSWNGVPADVLQGVVLTPLSGTITGTMKIYGRK